MEDNGQFLIKARARLGLDRDKFAEQLGVKRNSIFRYERGDPVPKAMRLAVERLLIEHSRNQKRNKNRRKAS